MLKRGSWLWLGFRCLKRYLFRTEAQANCFVWLVNGKSRFANKTLKQNKFGYSSTTHSEVLE